MCCFKDHMIHEKKNKSGNWINTQSRVFFHLRDLKRSCFMAVTLHSAQAWTPALWDSFLRSSLSTKQPIIKATGAHENARFKVERKEHWWTLEWQSSHSRYRQHICFSLFQALILNLTVLIAPLFCANLQAASVNASLEELFSNWLLIDIVYVSCISLSKLFSLILITNQEQILISYQSDRKNYQKFLNIGNS